MQPRVATSFWRIGTPADSTRTGYAVLHEGKKVRHCYPVTEYTATPEEETYRAFHHHGVAVENERMAYRIYFDKKQTIDIYCKRKPQLELAQSYWYPNDSLLALGYGDDILRVSGTVGVGSVKYWDGKLRHFDNVAARSQRIVSQKKDQATIEVADKGLVLGGQCIDLTVQYTLHAGDPTLRCDVSCSSPIEGLCTGVQSIPAKNAEIIDLTGVAGLTAKRSYSETVQQHSYWLCDQLTNGILLASWGTDWPVNDSAKYAKETVGLAVFIPHPYAGSLVHDKSNNLCLLHLTGIENAGRTAKRSFSDNGLTAERPEICHAHFYLTCVGATKENHPVASSATEWLAYLRKWAKGLR